ncbi:MAG TPA: subclass B3 metallo-beta-lactamase [Bryobacteraceae bacterium]|nr:subclass B3 metallo-beta-lactamase [Bryobacteraceae bacterium]
MIFNPASTFPKALFLALVLRLSLAGAKTNPVWTAPQKPFRIVDNLYYVGSRDLACFLITTPAGNILINANLESSPPQIRKSIETLGFGWADTKILLNSQAHFDHLAGAAAILQQTGAKLMVMDGDVSVAESGGASDFAALPRFPPVHVSRTLYDGDIIELGGVKLIAHKTPGHTRGCTTFTMQVSYAGRALNVVIIGGFAALDSYRLVATPRQPASYPGIAQDFEHTFAILRELPCDIFLGAHGDYFDMQEKLRRRHDQSPALWIDPEGYHRTVAEAQQKFEQRLQSEQAKSQSRASNE